MRRRDDPNVFTPDFLNHVERSDHESDTQYEAALAGPWHVVELDGRRFAVLRDGAGFHERLAAVLEGRETALLLAAVLPLIGTTNPYRIEPRSRDRLGLELQRIAGGRLHSVGHLRYREPDALEALHLAEGFLRSPAALARLLEAASYESLSQAGRLLRQRLAGAGS